MSFETADYPLVFRLDVCSEIWLEILNLDVALIALPHYDVALKGRYDKFSYTF